MRSARTLNRLVAVCIAVGAAGTALPAQQPGAKPELLPPPAMVLGKITGPDKHALEEAEVTIGSALRTFTDRKGRFEFDPVAAGVYDVLVRKIGFVPVRFRVAVTAGDVWEGTIAMERTAQTLAEVVVLDSAKALRNFRPRWLDGFMDRRRAGLGTFLDRVDIENARALSTVHLLAAATGVIPRSSMGYDELSVNRCGAGFGSYSKGIVYVDGIKTEVSTSGRFLTFRDYPPERLWAVEIFKGRGTIPPAYDDPAACLVVLLWTSRH